MKTLVLRPATILMAFLVAIVSLTEGCGKKAAAPPAEPVTAAQEGQPAPSVAQPPADSSATVAAAEAARKAREYQRSAELLLAIQAQQQLNEQQAQAVQQQMVRLQSDLAGAIARGDAQARAAAELLRRSASGAR